jgi:hypothetical protein
MRVKYFGHKASIDFEITVKPAHVVTCIKRSPFSCPVIMKAYSNTYILFCENINWVIEFETLIVSFVRIKNKTFTRFCFLVLNQ